MNYKLVVHLLEYIGDGGWRKENLLLNKQNATIYSLSFLTLYTDFSSAVRYFDVTILILSREFDFCKMLKTIQRMQGTGCGYDK